MATLKDLSTGRETALLLAVAFWHLIEKKALNLKKQCRHFHRLHQLRNE